MNHSLHHLGRTIAVPMALLAAVAAHAVPNPEATQQSSRMALRDACRDADNELQRAMGVLVAQRGLEGTVRIDMELQGDRIGAVSVAGNQGAYANDIRRAVRRLSCSSGQAERQVVSFEVNFTRDEMPALFAGRTGG